MFPHAIRLRPVGDGFAAFIVRFVCQRQSIKAHRSHALRIVPVQHHQVARIVFCRKVSIITPINCRLACGSPTNLHVNAIVAILRLRAPAISLSLFFRVVLEVFVIDQHLRPVAELASRRIGIKATHDGCACRSVNHLIKSSRLIAVNSRRFDLIPPVLWMFELRAIENGRRHFFGEGICLISNALTQTDLPRSTIATIVAPA